MSTLVKALYESRTHYTNKRRKVQVKCLTVFGKQSQHPSPVTNAITHVSMQYSSCFSILYLTVATAEAS